MGKTYVTKFYNHAPKKDVDVAGTIECHSEKIIEEIVRANGTVQIFNKDKTNTNRKSRKSFYGRKVYFLH